MQTLIKHLKKSRRYSEDFKKEMVRLFESGQYSILQLEKLYGAGDTSIYRWVYKYSKFNTCGVRVVEFKNSDMDKIKEMENKIKELEQAVGRKQIQIDFLEKMIEIAKNDYDIDIKKNYDILPSTGSDKGKKK
ncbi:MAG: transposase [Bacteroidetes bacterium]|nr:transposase [Bacteroidota bacterium]